MTRNFLVPCSPVMLRLQRDPGLLWWGYRLFVLGLILLLLTMLGGCTRGPELDEVRQVVSERLGTAFDEPVLEISGMRRLGSVDLADVDLGETLVAVYYNGRFTLVRDYRFGDWGAINPAALAQLLGAAEPGVTGINGQGNKAGDVLYVRGSVVFRKDGDRWVATEFVPGRSSATASTGGDSSSSARALVESIMRRFTAPPGPDASTSRAIIMEELEQALRQIDLRLDHLQQVRIVAGGPAGGEYDLIARTIADYLASIGDKVDSTNSHGSVQNVQMLRDGEIDLALVQNDVARMAYEGTGPFAGGAVTSLRALGSLFPEPIHIVVRADGPTSVKGLRGKRVALGAPGSGTRATALQVLEAHGLGEHDIQISDLGPVEAGDALARGDIDAYFSVVHAPARQLQQLAARDSIRLLQLAPEAIAALTAKNPALVPISLPAGTYPRQRRAVPTVAVAALLVGTSDLPNAEVRRLLQQVYNDIDFVAAGSSAGSMISLDHARTGVTIPMHTEAYEFLDEAMLPPLPRDARP